jgi:recombinational DNA repair protein (RecF pathway)
VDGMNDDKVICIECGNDFTVQDTSPKNGGRICDECEAVFIGRPEDGKELKFNEV